uniref:EBP like n=1 Tax=Oncorhynchus kisutch TaxID=8019 RepID=A0A8C7FBR1_ONCKI
MVSAAFKEVQSLFTPVTVYSLLACAAQFVVGYILVWVLVWLFYHAIVHITLVSVYCSNRYPVHVGKEYGKADERWLHSDPTIVSLELLTVVLDGILVLVYAIALYPDHVVCVCVCVCELYRGWVIFCPDRLAGSPNLKSDHWLYLWIYLVFFNGVWVVVPGLLLWQSWLSLKRLHLSYQAPKKQN